MLIGISGTPGSGQLQVLLFLQSRGFQIVSYGKKRSEIGSEMAFESDQQLIDYVTMDWKSNYVITHIEDADFLEKILIRPFFYHITVDAPILIRHKRYNAKKNENLSLEKFIEVSDELCFSRLSNIIPQLQLRVVNDQKNVEDLAKYLSDLDLEDGTRLRPNWDQYFMELADLASRRSNCMKRRVGCVIVRDNRIISTGYNGTPKNLPNCNEGGCERCNKDLNCPCLCLHLEENALLESGRDRVGANSVLYCNTCPCLQCTIKIIQTGISCVVYRNEYKFDIQSKLLLDQAGIELRRF